MLITSMAARLRRWRAYRRVYRELAALDARELDDLGIAPRHLRRIARDSIGA